MMKINEFESLVCLAQEYIVSYPEIKDSRMLSFDINSMFELFKLGYAILRFTLVILYEANNL